MILLGAGSLKKTMIPSPAKCSSVPSCSTTSPPTVAWYWRRKPRTGSAAENVVKFRRSQNIAVISRRWPPGGPRLRGSDELGDLWREEPGELAALALDRLEQLGVGDADRGLLGEAGRERPLGVLERADLVAGQREHAADRPSDWNGTPSSVR